jgi:hypothetical protein
MTRQMILAAAAALLLLPGQLFAQSGSITTIGAPQGQFEFVVAQPLEEEPVVKGKPFTAEAVTEFTQTLADGNRIERRFSTTLWRDSQGRTRREQQIALVGPLSVQGNPPRLVTITDPVAGTSYTLNAQNKTANGQSISTYTSSAGLSYSRNVQRSNTTETSVQVNAADLAQARAASDQARAAYFLNSPPGSRVQTVGTVGGVFFETTNAPSTVKTEPIGTRAIEGIAAEGTRTTTTIPAGAVGNVAPIEVVSERWFSQELQTAVLITQRDPRSGDTVYRLTNIRREEPSADLFTVPSTYTITSPAAHFIRAPAAR